MQLLQRLNIGGNHKISLDISLNAVVLHYYNMGIIGSFFKNFYNAADDMRCGLLFILLVWGPQNPNIFF